MAPGVMVVVISVRSVPMVTGEIVRLFIDVGGVYVAFREVSIGVEVGPCL